MGTLIINASPRADGNSAFITRNLAESFGNDAETIDLRLHDIMPCKACKTCKKTGKLCIIDDAMKEIYPRLLAADKIVLISPNHFGFLSSLGKLFTDRWYCLRTADKRSLFEPDKKAVFIFVQGAPSKDKGERTSDWAKHFFGSYGFKFYSMIIAGCSDENTDTPAMKINEIKMSTAIF